MHVTKKVTSSFIVTACPLRMEKNRLARNVPLLEKLCLQAQKGREADGKQCKSRKYYLYCSSSFDILEKQMLLA